MCDQPQNNQIDFVLIDSKHMSSFRDYRACSMKLDCWSIFPNQSYLDCLFVKIRNEGHVKNRAVYLAIAINMEGKKEVLGLWIEQTEGAKFWLKVMNELKTRGVDDILIACVDGLKGFHEAIETVYPNTEIQLCIVHMVRNSLKYVGPYDKKKVAKDLKLIYSSATLSEAENQMDAFRKKYDEKYPARV